MKSPAQYSLTASLLDLDGRLHAGNVYPSLFDIVSETEFNPKPLEVAVGPMRTTLVTYVSVDSTFFFQAAIEKQGWNDWGLTLHYFMLEEFINGQDAQTHGHSLDSSQQHRHSCITVDVKGSGGNTHVGWYINIGQSRVPVVPPTYFEHPVARDYNSFWSSADPASAFDRTFKGGEIWKAVMLLRAAIDHDDPELKLKPFFNRRELGIYLFRKERTNAQNHGD